MRTAGMFISGLGVFLPETVSVDWAVEEGLYPAEEARTGELTGVAIAGQIPAPEMALRAARLALERSGAHPGKIDLLLYADAWHQGPDGWLPHYYLQRYLVGGETLAMEVRQGCNGMFAALELAAGYLGAGSRHGTALLVAADNFGTPLIDRWRSGPGFISGDGASSVVLSREPGFAEVLAVRSITIPQFEELHRAGEPLFPPGATTGRTLNLLDRVAEFKQKVSDRPDIMDVWFSLYRQLIEIIHPTLAEAGIEMSDVRRVAFPNSGRVVVEQRWMSSLGLPLSSAVWEFGRGIGHVGASDQWIALDHLLGSGEMTAGDHLLMVGVGPGITLSSAVVKVHQRPAWLGPDGKENREE